MFNDGVGMKPTWQRWHVWDVLEANNIDADNVALVDIDTMVHWDCPNFFEERDEFGKLIDYKTYKIIKFEKYAI